MLELLRKRNHKTEEDGFTLIELMVVVLIIAILIAIAIPTFLGAQNRARDRGVQSNLRNALTAAKTIATDDAGLFTTLDVATLTAAEGALDFEAAAVPSAVGKVAFESQVATSPNTLVFEGTSASGSVFAICANSQGEVKYAKNSVALGGCTLAKW